jgi:hypothetical protein
LTTNTDRWRAQLEEVFAPQPGDDDAVKQLRADLLALLLEACYEDCHDGGVEA